MITFSGLRNLAEDFGVSGGEGGKYLGFGGLGDFAIFRGGGNDEITGCGGRIIGTGGDDEITGGGGRIIRPDGILIDGNTFLVNAPA